MSIHSRLKTLGALLAVAGLAACGSDGASGGAAGATSGSAAGAAASVAGASANPSGGTAGASGSQGSNGGAVSAAGGSNASAGASVTASAGAGAAGAPATSACTGNATYQITLTVTWSNAAVKDKHYTTVIGGVHGAGASFWKLGGTATDGVKAMAEAGGTMLLGAEVGAAIAAGTAKSVIQFGGGNAPGKSASSVELTPSFSQLSFGSMLAPTPDWFVGVSSLELCEAGSWLPSKTVPAVVYDAGTKDGADFDYGFPETEPRAPIGYAVLFPNQLPAGTIELVKQ